MTTGSILDYAAHGPAEHADGTVAAFKPGEKAEHPYGIKYMGPWERYADGFCEHVRRSARALAGESALPVHLRSVNQENMTVSSVPEMDSIEKQLRPLLRASVARYAVEVYQVVPFDSNLQFLTTHRYLPEGEMRVVNACRALYTVWERERISSVAVSALNRVAQAWVACPANGQMLIENGVRADKIRVIPCPFFPGDPHLALQGRARQPGPPRFYHIGKWEPRKAQDKMIGVFLRAFRPGEAQLWLKVSPFGENVKSGDFPRDPGLAIHRWLEDAAIRDNGWTLDVVRRSIFIVAKRLSDEDLVKFHAMGDVYVSLSRGEGFDMPALDAKLSGNALLYTPSGGTQAFGGPGDEMVPASGHVPCHPLYHWNDDATYLEYDVDSAAVAMRLMALRVPQFTRQPNIDLSRFAAATVGKAMSDCVAELLQNGQRARRELEERSNQPPEDRVTLTHVEPVADLGPRILFATHGSSMDAPYGGIRVNALLSALLKHHPLIGSVEVVPHDQIPDSKPDVAFVEVPTGSPYIRRLGAKRVVLLRYGDQGHGACAYEIFEEGKLPAVVVVPTHAAAKTLSYRIPYRVIYNAFESPESVRVGGKLGKKMLYTGAYRFAKDTPLAAKVATACPDVEFVWRRSALHEPLVSLNVPPNVEILDATADRDELWHDVGGVLVTSRYESFCLIAYEAMCRGVPVVVHDGLDGLEEWEARGQFAETVDQFAGMCKNVIARVTADPEAFAFTRAVADKVHQLSLAQLDQFVRDFVLEDA